MRIHALCLIFALLMCACSESKDDPIVGDGLPDTLAFEYARPDVGEPLSQAEVTRFTRRLTGFWKKVGFFEWVMRVSHGVHESTGKRDYAVWWSGVEAYREGDGVRFYHVDPDGGGHNIMIPTPRLLSSAISGYLLTGDGAMAEVAEQYCKGMSATMLGMVYDDQDPIDFLMARNVATLDHSYTTAEGYEKTIDYTGWHAPYEHWNTCRFEYPDNPHWGSVWVTNMRSKDDVPHIYMAVPHVIYAAARAENQAVKDACSETLRLLEAFTKDIVDQGYRIRSKDEDGEPFLPGYTGDAEKDEAAGDLATFVMWEELIPNAECNAKRTSALIGTGEGQGLNCGQAETNNYEAMAGQGHYYNRAIYRFFHAAHIANALTKADDAAAQALLLGMAARIETLMDTADVDLPRSRSEWENDIALLALRSAAFGLPLTSREARLIHEKWDRGVTEFAAWPNWNIWAPGVAQGRVDYRPGHVANDEHWTRIEDMALVLEYCWSPFRNPAGVEWIDCELVADPTRWDETAVDE